MKKAKFQQNTTEWLEWRRQGLGASDAPILMGVSPWKTIHELWREKALGEVKEFRSFATERGKRLEDEAVEEVEKLLGVSFFTACIEHPEFPWLRASLDGLSLDEDISLEIKCPGSKDHLSALNGQVPEKYTWQLQHQMMVTGHKSMYYYSYDGSDGVLLEYKADEEMQTKILEKAKWFWQKVQNKESIELGPDDYLPIADERFRNLSVQYRTKKAQAELIEQELEEIRKGLLAFVQDHPRVKGSGLMIFKSERKGSIDYAKIPELKEINLENYRKPASVSFTIREYEEELEF